MSTWGKEHEIINNEQIFLLWVSEMKRKGKNAMELNKSGMIWWSRTD